MDASATSRPSRTKLVAVILGASVMVAIAFAFYYAWQRDAELSSRIYEESPDIMIYAEQDVYNMSRSETIEIRIFVEMTHKGKQVNAQIAVFGGNETDIPERVFVETGEATLPAGFTGHLDKSSIYLPADEQDDTRIETVFLTLESERDAAAGDYTLSPMVFSNDISGNPFTISSSFVVHVA